MSGQWEPLIPHFPHPAPGSGFRVMHMAHLRTGKVLMFNDGASAGLWDPGTGDFDAVPNTTTDLRCAGHSALADGRLLVVGGTATPPPNDASLFDPDDEVWSPSDPMASRRWYPTCTTLPDGKVLVTDGHVSHGTPGSPHVLTKIPELFDPDAAPGQKWESLLDAELEHEEVYPRMFVLPDGNPVNVKLRALSQRLMTETEPWKWVVIPDSNPPVSNLWAVTHIMYEPGKVLRCGGAPGASGQAVKVTALIDFNQADLEWRTGDSMDMFFGRRNHNLVMLPDGKILVVGGSLYKVPANGDPQPVMEAEIFDPADETWETLASMTDPRWGHSTAILLRDAKVLTAGGEIAGTYTADSAQIFRPPYLDGDPDRASFVAPLPPSVINYGLSYNIGYTHPGNLEIGKACLIRLAAVTHSFDQDQRYVPVTVAATNGGPITVTAPANGNIAPPGYYMLFILDANGVPCESAAYVRVAA